MTGAALLVRADARRLPLPDGSVDLIVTSPPYFALRAYTDNGRHYPGQLGSECHWRDYLAVLWACTAEMARVLRPTGSIWVNLGDKHVNYHGPHYGQGRSLDGPRGPQRIPAGGPTSAPDLWGIPNKSLIGLPWRYVLGCIDQLGLTLRRDLIWHKPNPIPESARDRAHTTHEYWFHLVKQPRYYAAVDELRQPYQPSSTRRDRYGYTPTHFGARNGPDATVDGGRNTYHGTTNPLGRMPGSVWSIPTEQLRGIPDRFTKHYAAFATEWPRRLILGWSPPGICLVCGHGRVPIIERRHDPQDRATNGPQSLARQRPSDDAGSAGVAVRIVTEAQLVGYACACTPNTHHPGTGERSPTAGPNGRQAARPADIDVRHRQVGPWIEYHLNGWAPPPTRPAVVLDPFGGTGTVAGVARTLGRIGISIDLSADYCQLARWRIHHSGHFSKATARTWAERQTTLLPPTSAEAQA